MAAKKTSKNSPTTPATRALDSLQIAYDVHPYDHDSRVSAYGEEAASALGVDKASVFKTLVVHLDDYRFGVAILPVANQADLKAIAASLGAKRAALAQEKDVVRLTGYVLGGCSPLGQRTTLSTVLDSSAHDLDRVYISGGRRGFDISLSPIDLVTATHARVAPILRVEG